MDYKDFPKYYRENIENNGEIGLVFGRLSVAPQSFLRETVVHNYEKPAVPRPAPGIGSSRKATTRSTVSLSTFQKPAAWAGGRGGLWKNMQNRIWRNASPRNQAMNQKEACLVSRNEEMYDDMAYLENRLRDTDILQEYFVPYDRMPEFVDGLREVVQRNHANLLNVTIRTVHKDTISALPYAKQDMFGFVLYFNVKFNEKDNEILRKTTTDLIDMAWKVPAGLITCPINYSIHASQLQKSYPEIDQFFATKKKYDPIGLFTNKFYEKYGS